MNMRFVVNQLNVPPMSLSVCFVDDFAYFCTRCFGFAGGVKIKPQQSNFSWDSQQSARMQNLGGDPAWQKSQHAEHNNCTEEITQRIKRSIALIR